MRALGGKTTRYGQIGAARIACALARSREAGLPVL
jgi:hypothetical protein